MRSVAILAVLCVAVLLVGGGAAQQTQPLPGPGSGIMQVRGTVDIGNTPIVSATQQGEWKVLIDKTADVRVANTPAVNIAAPEFVKKGSSYTITWATGEQERVAVTQVGATGWIRAERDGRPRWINVATARAIEETP